MVFVEEAFVFYFLPLFLAIYYLLPFKKVPDSHGSRYVLRNLFISIGSYIFYGWFMPWYVSLMLISTFIDFFAGLHLDKKEASPFSRKIALTISMCANLGLLGFFKYFVFVEENLNWILEAFGRQTFQIIWITLPIGISFYTFQTMSYTIDLYTKVARPVKSFTDFSCFVSLFPQLIAGPIVRYNTLAEQLHSRIHSLDFFARGAIAFMMGFAMKIWLADPAGRVGDAVFATDKPMILDAWWGAIGYSFQIYFDFNAYSSMACGLAMMMGFQFLKNFDDPYRSKSITEFWRRWHISLSSWLRDYLYIPLGGNKKGKARTYINLAAVMLLGGLWHGSHWQFVVWGAIHGVFLVFERWDSRDGSRLYERLPFPLRWFITYVIVLFAWVFFRADNLSHAVTFIGCMLGAVNPGEFAGLLSTEIFKLTNILEMGLIIIVLIQPFQAYDMVKKISWPIFLWALFIFIMAIIMMYTQAFSPFLYFQF